MRTELVGEIADAVGLEHVVFEAPTKAAQAWFIKHFGPEVNLGNIPPDEVIPLETLRLGLRGDTLKEVLLGDAQPCSSRLTPISAEDLLVWAYEQFGDGLCLTCSWQKQSSVLVHMVSELGLPIDVIELDTQLFFRESYETRDRLVERYGLNLIQPQVITVAEQHQQEGPNLWERDPDRCCHIRKVEPLLEALEPYDAWVVRHPPRPVAEPRRHAEGPVVGALRGLEAPPARRLGREARLGLHPGQRDSLQPAARDRLPVDRLHPLHPADDAGGGGARRPLGRLRQARVRHPRIGHTRLNEENE